MPVHESGTLFDSKPLEINARICLMTAHRGYSESVQRICRWMGRQSQFPPSGCVWVQISPSCTSTATLPVISVRRERNFRARVKRNPSVAGGCGGDDGRGLLLPGGAGYPGNCNGGFWFEHS